MQENIKIDYLDINKIKPYKWNAKKHPQEQIDQIVKSIEQFGNCDPIAVWGEKNTIVEGHGRYLALKQLGVTGEIPVIHLDHLSDDERRAYGLVHNKLTMNSGFDFDLLEQELNEIDPAMFDMADFGFFADDGPDRNEPAEIIEDEVPKEVETRCRLGDLWQLGNHRLICGDSTDPAVIDRLMDGVKADMVFTDPPYGVNVKGGKHKGNLIMGDLTQTAIPFSFEIAVQNCTKEKAHFYFCGGESNIQLYQKLFDRYLHMLPKHLIWVKNGFVMKQNGYHNQFEIIFHGYKEGSGALWYGGRTEDEASDVWKIKRDASSSYLHPTQKPIEVPARAIKNSSPNGGIVVDLFGGSGSTLIACEQLNRKCYMCELDPHYCDVIIQRWEDFTGQKAVLLEE